MKNDRGTQPRSEIRRIRSQIAHRLIEGKIQPRLDTVIDARCCLKGLCQRQPESHRLNVQVVILIDEDADAGIWANICRTMGLLLRKLLADEAFLNEDSALEVGQLINFDPFKRLSERLCHIRKDTVQRPLDLSQLTAICAAREREIHEIASKPHTA